MFASGLKSYVMNMERHSQNIKTKLVKMDVDTGDSPLVSSGPYTLPLKHYEWIQKEIESLE